MTHPVPPTGPVRVLLAGESWSSYGVHIKGFNAYYTGFYDEGGAPLIEALEAGGCIVTYQPNHVAATRFPDSVAELDAYDVVVLSDIGSDTLLLHPDTFRASQVRPDRLAVLADWVRGGGGLLMVGGYMGFTGYAAAARYGMTPLADVLPVTLMDHDDRIETPAGVSPVATGEDAARILGGIDGPWPPFLGYNRLRERDGSSVLLRHEADPFLVTREVAAGRSAAFASDCSPHWGSPEFTAWAAYPRFWRQLVEWLAVRR
ncbi:MAG: glutamine amidotransferase [Chloroflexi bacterium]|nr:glutamine amidotransferase [Chloroflexota bacterium]